MSYQPEGGEEHLLEWYYGQEEDLKAQFVADLLSLAWVDEWDEETDCVALTGQYLGLNELVIDIKLATYWLHIRPVGIWKPDSRDFIILLCCEKNGDDYDPPLSKALEYKTAWEQHKGEIYDRTFGRTFV